MPTTQTCTTSETLMAKMKQDLANPKIRTCGKCEGEGRTHWVLGADEGTEICIDCDGEGELQRCDECNGTGLEPGFNEGLVPVADCEECNGKGEVAL